MKQRKKRWPKVVTLLLIILIVSYAWLEQPWVSANIPKAAKTKHLVVISVDGVSATDMPLLATLPHFKEMMTSGSYAKQVRGIYPTVTYPSHTSIITGAYPNKHGLVNNIKLQPGVEEPKWHWAAEDVRVKTLVDVAKERDFKVGALFWPVMAGADIEFNLPEIWTTEPDENQTLLTLSNGTPRFLLGAKYKHGDLLDGKKQPNLDDFTTANAVDLIENEQPNLLLVHLTDADTNRHYTGNNSITSLLALERHDKRIGKVLAAIKRAGIEDETTVVVLGDHGHSDVTQKIQLNVLLKQAGLIQMKGDKVTSWKAFVQTADGAAQVYCKTDDACRQTRQIIADYRNQYKGIKQVIERDEMKRLHADMRPQFMLEAEKSYYFTNALNGEPLAPVDAKRVAQQLDEMSTHGYLPDTPGLQTIFMMKGKGVKQGVVLPSIDMVDEGPTMAKLLGLTLPSADGKALDAFLEE